jgi:hypothetical protein
MIQGGVEDRVGYVPQPLINSAPRLVQHGRPHRVHAHAWQD